MNIIDRLAETPAVCVFLAAVLFFFSYFVVYSLLDSLLKMHRSNTAVKKIKKKYKFYQKLWLLHFEECCLHSVRFCKFLILFQRISSFFFALYLLAAVLILFGLSINVFFAWLTVGIFVCFDLPIALIDWTLARPILGRFRGYSFEKYHNTQDRSSLL